MADIDLSLLTPRDQDVNDKIVVMKEGSPDEMGLVDLFTEIPLKAVAIPSAPPAGRLKLFGRNVAGRILPSTIGPSGLDSPLQPHLGLSGLAIAQPVGNSTTINTLGIAVAATGTATTKNMSSSTLYGRMKGLNYLVTTASTTAIAGFRGADIRIWIGGPSAELGGFHYVCRWGVPTGAATATQRAFVGLLATVSALTDVEPSSRVESVGMGWDAADTNIQFMHNDASGVATKIDLGSSFPVPTTNEGAVYEIAMFAPPGTTQSVTYRIRNLTTGVEATGTVTTNLPANAQGLSPHGATSVGGTSSVTGITLFKLYIETDY